MASDEEHEHEHWTVGIFLTPDNKMYIHTEALLDVIEEHTEEDCFCASCSWLRHVLLPGLRAALFEQEVSAGIDKIPTTRGRRR